jgi:protein SCO1/2
MILDGNEVPRVAIGRVATKRKAPILVLLGALVVAAAPSPAADNVSDPRVHWTNEPVPLPEFRLTDEHGRPFGLAELRGRTALLFFGFTNCRNVCPATMQVLRQVERSVKGESKSLVNVFVSVDGARDTPAVLRDYLAPFKPGFIGLTGEPTEVRVLADKLSAVFFKGMPVDDRGGYDVEHTSQVYLIDAQGRLRATFYAAGADAMATATRRVLGE